MKKQFIKDTFIAILSQGFSLLCSFAISFIVPKILGVNDFSYWQLFLFYVSYVNISRLGSIDGIYLRLGGKDIKDLNSGELKSKWVIFILYHITLFIILCIPCVLLIPDRNRMMVILFCLVAMILINNNNFFGFIFQATNNTKIYSYSEVIYHILWLIGLVVLYFLKQDYNIMIYFYLLGQFLTGIYLMYKAKFVFNSKMVNFHDALISLKEDIKVGVPLLVSMYASMLIIGSARFVVDYHWGIEVFGAFSFALSLSTFVLKFISQISMVLYPILRKIDFNKLSDFFKITNTTIRILLPIVLLLFVPIKLVFTWWLPQYSDSIIYFGYLLPLCIYDGKMQLLYSTYLKVIDKSDKLLLFNVISTLLSLTLSITSIFIFDSLESIAIVILISIFIRSLLSEIYLSHILRIRISYYKIFLETIINFIFVTIIHFEPLKILIITFIILIIYFSLNLKQLVFNFKEINKFIKAM